MNQVLSKNLFFVKEHLGLFKASNNYDIFDPETQDLIMECREQNMSVLAKLLRFTDFKTMTPFDIVVVDAYGSQVLRVKRNFALFLSTVEVFDETDKLVGKFKQRFFSIGGKFDVFDKEDSKLCTLKGKWTSWDFKFISEGVEFAHVSKKWAGVGKELFSSADNYMLEIASRVHSDNPLRILIVAAVLCIDMVLKE
jgi:uncharacterized protein YxjI